MKDSGDPINMAPDWLLAHDGDVRPGVIALTWLVTFKGDPLYRLNATTARGQYTCVVVQTNNGKRLDGGKSYASSEAALAGGLDELRAQLGW